MMPTDPMKAFEGLHYPGSRPPRSRKAHEQPAPAPVDDGWDSKPKIIKRKGVDTEFFTIGDLARALGRKQVTIRSWEDKGWLPKARFRTPVPKRSALEKENKKPAGRRLYTRHQVDVIIKAAHETGVMNISPDSRPDWKQFTKLVVDGWLQEGK